MKAFILRHLQSAGFQRRLKNIYIPLAKQGLTFVYRYFHGKLEQNQFAQEYQTDKVIEGEDDEVLSTDSYSATGNILTEEDAIELFKKNYVLNHEPQKYGTCVAHTMKNIHRFAIKTIFGDESNFSEHDVYIDRYTRTKGLDMGMSPSKTFKRMAEKGIAVRGVVPTATSKSDLQTTREDYPDDKLAPFRVKMIKKNTYLQTTRDFEPLWNYLVQTYNTHGVRPFQFSITSRQGWWGKDVPTATGKTYGGHSVMGLTIPFMHGNKRAFLAIDSSYRRGTSWKIGQGVRIVTEDCWNGLGGYVRPVEYVPAIEAALVGAVIPPVTPDAPSAKLLTVTAALGQSNAYVSDIQKALISIGFPMPAITSGNAQYGYYGVQTAEAVLKFQLAHVNRFMARNPMHDAQALRGWKGEYFGEGSIAVMNELLRERG